MGYMSSAAMLSQIAIDTDLIMGAHNITLGVNRTVDGKDVGRAGFVLSETIKKLVSDDLRHSIDAIVTETTTSYVKKKTLTFTNGIYGVLRIKFSIYSSGAQTTTAILTRNGVVPGGGSDIGVVQTQAGNTPTVKSQDLTLDILAGETIDLWLHTQYDPGEDAFAKELRVYYTEEGVGVAVTGAD